MKNQIRPIIYEIHLNRDVSEEEIQLGDAVLIANLDDLSPLAPNGQVGLVEGILKMDRTTGHHVGRAFKVRTAEWVVQADITELAGRLETRRLNAE